MNKEIYAIFEESRILKMSESKEELIRYKNSFPDEVRRRLIIARRTKCGWVFERDSRREGGSR